MLSTTVAVAVATARSDWGANEGQMESKRSFADAWMQSVSTKTKAWDYTAFRRFVELDQHLGDLQAMCRAAVETRQRGAGAAPSEPPRPPPSGGGSGGGGSDLRAGLMSSMVSPTVDVLNDRSVEVSPMRPSLN